MTAQPAEPAAVPDTGSYEVIRLGGQAAVVVLVADFLWLRALEQAATAQELEDAEDTAAVLAWKARDAAGQPVFVPACGSTTTRRRSIGRPGFSATIPRASARCSTRSTGWPPIPARPGRSGTGHRTCGACRSAATACCTSSPGHGGGAAHRPRDRRELTPRRRRPGVRKNRASGG